MEMKRYRYLNTLIRKEQLLSEGVDEDHIIE